MSGDCSGANASTRAPRRAIWRVRLAAPSTVQWQAGDILHIAPRHNAQHASAVLEAHGLDPLLPCWWTASRARCWHWPVNANCPAPTPLAVQDPGLWLSGLPLLPGREYSIASAADDGVVELVVRLVHDTSGRAGLGSDG